MLLCILILFALKDFDNILDLINTVMPQLTLRTNLSASEFPTENMLKMVKALSPLVGVPEEYFSFLLETDKNMMKGAKEGPFVWLKIEAIGFDDADKLEMMTPKIYDFFKHDLKIDENSLIINYYNLPATHTTIFGKTCAEL